MRLLAVDDQSSVLLMLRRQIDCGKLGLESMDTAENTRDARALLQKNEYGIILCDIEMPGEDGISFAKWALEAYPYVQLIFLTSHADVSYMREAIAMHSFDYLLSPAAQDELEHAIRRAAVQAEAEKKNRQLLELGQRYQDYEEEISNHRASDWLLGEGGEEEAFLRLAEREGVPVAPSVRMLPFLIRFHTAEAKFATFDVSLLRFSLKNITDELLAQLSVRSFFVRREQEEYYGFLCAGETADQEPERESAAFLLSPFWDVCSNMFHAGAAVYLYETVDFEGIRNACARLRKVAAKDPENKKLQVVSESDVDDAAGLMQRIPSGFWRRLMNYGEFGHLKDSIHQYIGTLCQRRGFTLTMLVQLHREFTELLLSYLLEHGIESGRIFTEALPYQRYMNAYVKRAAFEEAVDYVIGRLAEVSGSELDAADAAIRYIRLHLMENISVTEIADSVGMNAEYLTRLFKKKTGLSLKTYLTQEKMELAKRLLETTGLSITMISDHIGFYNYNNFIRSFKKYAGITPAEYRRNCAFAANAGAPLQKAASDGQPPVTFHARNAENR